MPDARGSLRDGIALTNQPWGWIELLSGIRYLVSGWSGAWSDTIDAVTNEQTTRLQTFIRSTLGCGCPDEVLEWIQCTHTELTQEEDTRITRIDVGGRLLVWVLEIDGPDQRAEQALPGVIAAAMVDRATGCFNRLRIVVAIDDPEEMTARLERSFTSSAPLDDKGHLHIVSPMDLPFD